jgi:hypothetical protein
MSLKSERAKFRIPLLDPVDQFVSQNISVDENLQTMFKTVHSPRSLLPRYHLSFLHLLLTILN